MHQETQPNWQDKDKFFFFTFGRRVCDTLANPKNICIVLESPGSSVQSSGKVLMVQ